MLHEQKSGFTKTGFSKKGFGCCGHWQFCDLGKNECFYAKQDPEAKDHCHCYQRNHNEAAQPDVNLERIEDDIFTRVEEKEYKPTVVDQLSLF